MDELEILRILNKYNPWWHNKKIPASKLSDFKRSDFYKLKDELSRKEITSLVGPRRVGKTIVIHQLIQHLMDSNIDPKMILYLSVDDLELHKAGAEIGHILEIYSKYVTNTPFDSLKARCFLFLDEVQEIPDWEKILKNWQDFGYNLKFIISGSSSIWISKGSEESLLGRIKTAVMMPLKFSEVLRYNNILPKNFHVIRNRLRVAFITSVQRNNYLSFKTQLEQFIGLLSPLKENIEIILNRYLTIGGYPEFLEEYDYDRIGESIRDKIKLTFYKDIIRYFKIRNPEVLQDLFKFLAQNTGQQFNLTETAKLLGVERPTLRDYLKYLTKAYLIQSSEFYALSRSKRIRKQEKIYVLDPGIRNGVLDFVDENFIKEPIQVGLVVQSLLLDHLTRLKFNIEPGPEPEIFYWKERFEIDFLMTVKRKVIPIESKFRNDVPSGVVKLLQEFM